MNSKIAVLILLALLMTACENNPTPLPGTLTRQAMPTITATPDPCSQANIPIEIAKVNKHMREFDDYSTLASSTPNAQMMNLIPDMQRIRREAEDQEIPACLSTLKQIQLAHMNTVLQTLLAFVGQADANTINAGIAQARDLHTRYDVEIARLLGITLPPTATAISTP